MDKSLCVTGTSHTPPYPSLTWSFFQCIIWLCFHLSFFTCTPLRRFFSVHALSILLSFFWVEKEKEEKKRAMRVRSRSLQKSSSFNTDEDIEGDPFGYILSPSLSAGIRNDKSPRAPSPFWIKASSSSKSTYFSSSDRRLVKVKRWILRIESWYLRGGGGGRLPGSGKQHHQGQNSNSTKSSIKAGDDGTRATSMTGQARGRSEARTSSANREVHGMRPTAGRQHLWRKPSESLWPVLEESEDVTP